MPRNPIAALVQLLVALLVGAVGLVMLAWAVMGYFRIEWGFDAMLWAARNAPFAHGMAPEVLANAAIQDGAKIAIGVAGFILYRIGAALLRAARLNMQPAAASVPAAASAQVRTQASRAASPPRTVAAASAGSTVFARTLLSDEHPPTTPSKARSADFASHAPTHPHHPPQAEAARQHAAFTPPQGLEAHLAGWARLIGKDGRFTPQQRAALARLNPEQIALAKKLPDPAKAVKWAVIGVIALFFVLPFVLSVLGFILAAIFGN